MVIKPPLDSPIEFWFPAGRLIEVPLARAKTPLFKVSSADFEIGLLHIHTHVLIATIIFPFVSVPLSMP